MREVSAERRGWLYISKQAPRYLLAEKCFEKIVLFEQRPKLGGLWNHTPEDHVDAKFTVPQTDPRGSIENPIWRKPSQILTNGINGFSRRNGVQENSTSEPVFVSPIYDNLETNIPYSLMGYSDHPFSENTQLFPTHDTVLKYLEEYGKEVKHLIRFETQVLDVRLAAGESAEGQEQWIVKSKRLGMHQTEVEETFDAVVVANGHYSVPYVPDIEGIREWNQQYPGSISHSKFFRNADQFTNKVSTPRQSSLRLITRFQKVIVVGSSASGLDIGRQIMSVCKPPLLSSAKTVSYLAAGFIEVDKKEHPPIAKLVPEGRRALFEDGHVEDDIDSIIFCTGYFYSFPFLSSLNPSLISSGERTENTYKQLFYAPRPSLALLALPQKVIPFQIAEVQSAVVARAFAGRLALPTYEEMAEWEEKAVVEKGDGGKFHALMFPLDAHYINDLHDWAMTARPPKGSSADDHGKMPSRWGEWECWARERFPLIRKAFLERGDERSKVRHLDDIGFDFDTWKREQNHEV